MIIDIYRKFLDEVMGTTKLEMLPTFTQPELCQISPNTLKRHQKLIFEAEKIKLKDEDLIYFPLSSVSVCWRSNLPGRSFFGGFEINGITDALCIKDHFWKGAFSLAPDKEIPEHLKHFDRLGWFQQSADGTTQAIGCFIRQPGPFPPPVVVYYRGWYMETGFDFNDYLTKMFESFAFVGWQFFYVDFPEDIKDLEEILDNMQFAVEMLPKVFPGKDWNFYATRYEQTLKRLGR